MKEKNIYDILEDEIIASDIPDDEKKQEVGEAAQGERAKGQHDACGRDGLWQKLDNKLDLQYQKGQGRHRRRSRNKGHRVLPLGKSYDLGYPGNR